jgi:ribonucleoside-diphosphate reductase alpha chain
MKLQRRYTTPGQNPLDQVDYDKRTTAITNPDGSMVFEAKDNEIPKGWSQLAGDIMVSKYFRKAGAGGEKGRETSARQVVYRVAHTIAEAGRRLGGYFDTDGDAETFEAELSHILINQLGAFNSPVWFNCGLFHEYGITGSAGNWAWDFQKNDVAKSRTPTSAPSARPASSSPSTTASCRSSTCSRPRPASSSTARARAPTSPASAANRKSSPAAAPRPA